MSGSKLSLISNRLIFLVMLLNSGDACFTSLAIGSGAAEINPIMAAVLTMGMGWFLFNKLVVINAAILFLGLIGKHHQVGRIGMISIACAYTFLSWYHVGNLCLLYMRGT